MLWVENENLIKLVNTTIGQLPKWTQLSKHNYNPILELK
jgi:hypothetical protein